jgi:hypothetical protein
MKRITGWIVFLVGLLVLVACSSQQASPPVTSQPALPATPTVETAQSIFGPGTFSISLPEGWDVASSEINTDPTRPYTLFLLGDNPTGNDGPGISQVVVAEAGLWTPEDFVLSRCSTCPQNPFEQVTLGGKDALRTEIGGGGVPFFITWYFIENKGNFIALAIHDPQTLQPLEEVLSSIQFE